MTHIMKAQSVGLRLCDLMAASQRPLCAHCGRKLPLYLQLAGVGVQTGRFLNQPPPARQSLCAGGQPYPRQLVMLLCRLLCRRIFGMDVLTMPGTITGSMTPPPPNCPPRRTSPSYEGHPAPSHSVSVCAPEHKHHAQALPFFQQSGTLSNFFDFLI